MTYEEAKFILRHGSAEGLPRYLEAIAVIENEITRQKEEIDRYESIFGQLVEKDGEVIGTIGEKKQRFIRSDIADLMTKAAVKTAEDYARREFAERVKEIASQGFWESDSYVGMEQIDNLLKEMESEANV